MKRLTNLFVVALMATLFVTACGDTGTNPTPDDESVLRIASNVDNALIYINGNLSEYQTPSDFPLQPGEYTIEVDKSGYLRASEYVDLRPGETRKIVIDLTEQTIDPPCDNSCRNDQICDEVNDICICPEGKEDVDDECTVVGEPCDAYDWLSNGQEYMCGVQPCTLEFYIYEGECAIDCDPALNEYARDLQSNGDGTFQYYKEAPLDRWLTCAPVN